MSFKKEKVFPRLFLNAADIMQHTLKERKLTNFFFFFFF